jgi:hypothetical protein
MLTDVCIGILVCNVQYIFGTHKVFHVKGGGGGKGIVRFVVFIYLNNF